MTSGSPEPVTGPDRRTVVAAAGAAGLAAALTACGSTDMASGADHKQGGKGGGAALAKTSDIPEGGGKIFKDQGVVVTQPTAGTYKAFSAQCTHQGCTVGSIMGDAIVCPCHKSQFSIVDGNVKQGPATRPLPSQKITVSGGEIKLA
jgi:nitrite reductase/ring-hydroxylating ferredoxin subunit